MCDSGEGLNRVAKHTGRKILKWSDSNFLLNYTYNLLSQKLMIVIIEIFIVSKTGKLSEKTKHNDYPLHEIIALLNNSLEG